MEAFPKAYSGSGVVWGGPPSIDVAEIVRAGCLKMEVWRGSFSCLLDRSQRSNPRFQA